ncbi:hypothetical protein [Roseibium sp. RKSG952]|uniref:hypothetical protein n=1 Tax=Roseibium sp. RKSG952 TaxID=2529384 RepID=UPI0012BBDCD5|nr:hypothetical protein [Roseibium sp. RKSG952]MTH95499.1 hypothetical protein [Roseibium sp. RKSG952]
MFRFFIPWVNTGSSLAGYELASSFRTYYTSETDVISVEEAGDAAVSVEDARCVTYILQGTIDASAVAEDGADTVTTDGVVSSESSAGLKMIVSDTGSIDASGDGMALLGDYTKVFNAGSITSGGDGIRIGETGDTDIDPKRGLVVNTGVIESAGSGIETYGAYASVWNFGTVISTNDRFGDNGISVYGENSLLINAGEITAGYNGVDFRSENGVAINYGTITGGNKAINVERADNLLVVNYGTLIATGDDAMGTEATINHSKLINHGTIYSQNDSLGDSAIIIDTGSYNLIENTGEIFAFGEGIDYGDGESSNSRIVNSGQIEAGSIGIQIDNGTSETSVTNSGSIVAGTDGIGFDRGTTASEQLTIVNSGTITTGERGIAMFGNSGSITNSGAITAEKNGVEVSGDGNEIQNHGFIEARDHAIDIEEGVTAIAIVNSGTLTSTAPTFEFKAVIDGSDGVETTTNSGLIDGEVRLYGGDDVYTVAEDGQTTGGVYGGAGNDILTGGNFSDFLSGGAGDDTMTGNGGADEFELLYDLDGRANLDVATNASGADDITDFGFDEDTLVVNFAGTVYEISSVAEFDAFAVDLVTGGGSFTKTELNGDVAYEIAFAAGSSARVNSDLLDVV